MSDSDDREGASKSDSDSGSDDSDATVREYDIPQTRDVWEARIEKADDIQELRTYCTHLMSLVMGTTLAPPIKNLVAQNKVEIRLGDHPHASQVFDCREIKVREMEEKFELPGLAFQNAWLEHVSFREAPVMLRTSDPNTAPPTDPRCHSALRRVAVRPTPRAIVC
jgi:hypothetical protein